MTKNSAFAAYQLGSAQGASPLGGVVALYDTILRDFQRALAAIDAGKVEIRVFELNHALTVMGELQGVLNFERGGEAAKRLDQFYNLTRPMVVQANVSGDRESVRRLVELFTTVRQAWQQAERQLASGGGTSTNLATQASARQMVQSIAADNLSPVRGNWSA
jgi:flagellar secretion chaperone FliS